MLINGDTRHKIRASVAKLQRAELLELDPTRRVLGEIELASLLQDNMSVDLEPLEKAHLAIEIFGGLLSSSSTEFEASPQSISCSSHAASSSDSISKDDTLDTRVQHFHWKFIAVAYDIAKIVIYCHDCPKLNTEGYPKNDEMVITNLKATNPSNVMHVIFDGAKHYKYLDPIVISAHTPLKKPATAPTAADGHRNNLASTGTVVNAANNKVFEMHVGCKMGFFTLIVHFMV